MTIGLAFGFAAALLAVCVQHFAIELAGFLAGGYLSMQLPIPLFHLEHGWLAWLAFIVGGIIGVILVSAFLDWALIGLSSLAGASLLVESFNLNNVAGLLLFIVLLAFGVSVQMRELRKEKK